MAASIVGYLKMLVTLGAIRHQLAIDYDLPDRSAGSCAGSPASRASRSSTRGS